MQVLNIFNISPDLTIFFILCSLGRNAELHSKFLTPKTMKSEIKKRKKIWAMRYLQWTELQQSIKVTKLLKAVSDSNDFSH